MNKLQHLLVTHWYIISQIKRISQSQKAGGNFYFSNFHRNKWSDNHLHPLATLLGTEGQLVVNANI